MTGSILAVAWWLGRRTQWRTGTAALGDDVPRASRTASATILLLCGVLATIMVCAFREYAAPNHLDDASNHAFMARRIAEAGSVATTRVFAPPYGQPAIPYQTGWHVTAALVAETADVPPWASVWYMAFFAAAALPLALSLFYRMCGLRPLVVVLGVAFAVANYFTPVNIFSWGGFGAIIGTSLVAFAVLTLRACLDRPSREAVLTAGLGVAALAYVHSTEIFVSLLLLLPAWRRRDDGRPSTRRSFLALASALGVALVAAALPLLPALLVYRTWTASEALPPSPGLAATAHEIMTYAGGNVPVLHWFVPAGLLAGLLGRRERRLGLLALAFVALYCGLRQWHDPVSLLLGRPFYRHAGRVIYPLAYLLPPLMASAVIAVASLPGRPLPGVGRRLLAGLAGALLVWKVLFPGIYWNYRNLEYQKRFVPFSASDARLARAMAERLPPAAVVANQYGDGSYWAMHVSGLRFLDPCSWPLGEREGLCHRPTIARFLERPWPPEVCALRELGTEYVYVSDTVIAGVQPPLTRARLDADPRFVRLLDDGDDAVYRILWSAEPLR